jgi:hypothetical protein
VFLGQTIERNEVVDRAELLVGVQIETSERAGCEPVLQPEHQQVRGQAAVDADLRCDGHAVGDAGGFGGQQVGKLGGVHANELGQQQIETRLGVDHAVVDEALEGVADHGGDDLAAAAEDREQLAADVQSERIEVGERGRHRRQRLLGEAGVRRDGRGEQPVAVQVRLRYTPQRRDVVVRKSACEVVSPLSGLCAPAPLWWISAHSSIHPPPTATHSPATRTPLNASGPPSISM